MDISTEKRISDATAQEIAELNALKDKGFVMVPKEQFERLVRESFSYRLIITTYEKCGDYEDYLNHVEALLDTLLNLSGEKMKMTIRKEMAEMIAKRKDMEVRNRPAYEKGDDE